MSYTPPGWTPQRVAAATAHDLVQLDCATLHLMTPTAVSSPTAQDVLFGARIDERTRFERQRMKLPPTLPRFKPDTPLPEDAAERAVTEQRMRTWLSQERTRYLSDKDASLVPSADNASTPRPHVDPVVQVVQEAGYDDFGFVVVRLDYSDDDAWTRWSDSFDATLDLSLDESLGGDSIKDKLYILRAEDEDLDGTGWHGAVSYYKDLCTNHMTPPGLDASMILVADTKAVDSLLNPTPDIEPWIWAVDVGFDWNIGDQPPRGALPTNRYPGYIRVALSAVVPELWPLLNGPGVTGRGLWTRDLEVWKGV